jgi:hypothetical protein
MFVLLWKQKNPKDKNSPVNKGKKTQISITIP